MVRRGFSTWICFIIIWAVSSVEVLAIQYLRVDPVSGLRADFVMGVDISTLEKVEHYGGVFFDHAVETDVLDILKSRGVNWIRLKVWHDPVLDEGFNDKESLIKMARRVKEKGFSLLVNFHYSDHWADPGKQIKPAAWQGLPFPELKEAVYAYTYDIIESLRQASALPEMVQVGNEIRTGMIWPDGQLGTKRNEYGDDFDRLAQLLKAGIQGVHDGALGTQTQDLSIPIQDGEAFTENAEKSTVKIALHLDHGGDKDLYRWWFDEVVARGVDFDVIGLSYYPYWHGTLDQLRDNMNQISVRYEKEVAVFETAYAFTFDDADGYANIFGAEQAQTAGYPVSVQGQASFLRDVIEAVAQVPENRGLGIFYWEPAWLGIEGAGWTKDEGNAWENQALFDFGGNALDSLFVFSAARKPVIVGVEPIQIDYSSAKQALALPQEVNVIYSDGHKSLTKVHWDLFDLNRVKTGDIVKGAVKGTSIPAILTFE